MAFVFAFVLASFQNAKPDGKAQPPDENAKRMIKNSICRRKEIPEEKQKLDKNVNAAGEKKIGKDKTRSTERNEGGKESDRNCNRKGMKARKETKRKTGENKQKPNHNSMKHLY